MARPPSLSQSARALRESIFSRLAGKLARHGEGPIALYLSSDGLARPSDALRAPEGPFGPSRLLEPARMWGPFLIAAELGADASTTIAR